jgi:hypothetical protein
VVAAVVLVAGVSVTAVGNRFATDVPSDRVHPARAVAPGDPDPELEVASLRIADTRAPRPADAPLFATLAVLAALASLTFARLLLRRPRVRAVTSALVPCGPRAPPGLLAA